jgi:hypothetical protein
MGEGLDGPLVIGRRFCGPPGSGNGGYVCGIVAARLSEPAQVTLRRPPPLDTPLTVTRDEAGTVSVSQDGALVAEAVPVRGLTATRGGASEREHAPPGTRAGGADGTVASEPAGAGDAGAWLASLAAAAGATDVTGLPEPVPVDAAREAGAGSWLRTNPERLPFPACFVCGPGRADGLRILPGQVAGRNLSADVWSPAADLTGPDGYVRPEFLWAALDCTGGIGAFGNDPDGPPYLLGRFAVRQLAPVEAGQPHVVAGWRLGRQGRKLLAGSALFTAGGELAGLGMATWIQLA